jgi:hypothetical protein
MPGERQVSFEEFGEWLAGVVMPRKVEEVIVHHTEAPTAAQYRGIATVAAVRRYHMEERGWSDTGYHLMIGPGGEIFLCRPLEREGAHTLGHNERSVGLAYIANFDVEDPETYLGLVMGQQVVAALLQRFGLTPEQIHFHREFADKTCPGLKLELERFRKAVGSL